MPKLNILTQEVEKLNKIVIELNGNISKLTSESSKLQKETKQIASDNSGDELKKRNDAIKALNENTIKITNSEKELIRARDALAKQRQRALEQIAKQEHKQREIIKASQMEVKSLDDLKKKTNALNRLRDQANLKTKEGRKQFQNLTKEIKKNTDELKKNDKQVGRFQRNVGNYGSAFDRVLPGLSSVTAGTKMFFKLLLTNPIGIILTALASLIAYFKRSEEGQNALMKITKVLNVILGNLGDIASRLGKTLFEAFSKPKETLVKLGNILKENILNRFRAFGVMGRAIVKILKGDLKEGFKELGEGAVQMGTGIADIGDKVKNLADKAKKGIQDLAEETGKEIEIAKQLADAQANLDKIERQNIVTKAENAQKIADLILLTRDEAVSYEERAQALKDAIEIKKNELDQDLFIAQERLRIKAEENKLSESTKEDLDEEARLRAEVFRIQKGNADQLRELINRQNELENKVHNDRKTRLTESVNIAKELTKEVEDFEKDLFAELEEDSESHMDQYLEDYAKRQELREQELEKMKQQLGEAMAISQAVGEEIGKIIAGTEKDFKQFGKNLIMIGLDYLEKVILMSIAETTAKSIAKRGPAGIIESAFLTAIIKTAFTGVKTAVGKFAEGEVNIQGPGSETSDSIPAMISKGESVINSKGTRRAPGLLNALNRNATDAELISTLIKDVKNPGLPGSDLGRWGSFSSDGYKTYLETVQQNRNLSKLIRLHEEQPQIIPVNSGGYTIIKWPNGKTEILKRS